MAEQIRQIRKHIYNEYISARYTFLLWITRWNNVRLPIDIARVIIEKSATNIAAESYNIMVSEFEATIRVIIFKRDILIFMQGLPGTIVYDFRQENLERIERYFLAIITGDILDVIDSSFDKYEFTGVYNNGMIAEPLFKDHFTWKLENLLRGTLYHHVPIAPTMMQLAITSFVHGEFSIVRFMIEHEMVYFNSRNHILWDIVIITLMDVTINWVLTIDRSLDIFRQTMIRFRQNNSRIDTYITTPGLFHCDHGEFAAIMLMLQWEVGIDVSDPHITYLEVCNILSTYHLNGKRSMPGRVIPPRRDLLEWAMQKI